MSCELDLIRSEQALVSSYFKQGNEPLRSLKGIIFFCSRATISLSRRMDSAPRGKSIVLAFLIRRNITSAVMELLKERQLVVRRY